MSRRRHRGEEPRTLDRISQAYPWRGHREVTPPAFNKTMLNEDVSLTVFPIGGGDAVAVHPQDPEVQSIVGEGFSFGGDYASRDYDDVARAYCEWGRWCAVRLLDEGRAIFEIAYWLQGSEQKAVGFAVIPLPSRDVIRRRHHFVQRVPDGLTWRPHFDQPPQVIPPRDIEIPLERIVEIRRPPAYARDVLIRNDGAEPFPSFMLPFGEGSKRPVKADIALLQRTRSLSLAEATRDVGWNARGTFNDMQTEFYSVWRDLRFERFKLALREAVTMGANEILKKAGTRLGFQAALKLQNVASDGDLAWAEEHLLAGDVSSDDIYRGFRHERG